MRLDRPTRLGPWPALAVRREVAGLAFRDGGLGGDPGRGPTGPTYSAGSAPRQGRSVRRRPSGGPSRGRAQTVSCRESFAG